LRSFSRLDLRQVMRRLRRARGSTAGRILFTRAPLSAEALLMLRGLLVSGLFAAVLIVFYLDRDGLSLYVSLAAPISWATAACPLVFVLSTRREASDRPGPTPASG
jgi:hypothetical protein